MQVVYTLDRRDLRRCTFYLMCGRHSSVVEVLALFAFCAIVAGLLVNMVMPVYIGCPLLIAFVLAVLMYPLALHLINLLLTQLIAETGLGFSNARPQSVTLGHEGVRLTQPGRDRLTDWAQIVWVERSGRDIYFYKARGAFFVPGTAFAGHQQAEQFLEAVSAYKQMHNRPETVWPPPPTLSSRRLGR